MMMFGTQMEGGALQGMAEMIVQACLQLFRGAVNWYFWGFPVLGIFNSLLICVDLRLRKKEFDLPPIHALVAVWILCFGGVSLTAAILAVPFPWAVGNANWVVYTVIPILVFYCPGDAVFRLFHASRHATYPAMLVTESVGKTLAIARFGVDAVRYHHLANPLLQNSLGTAIICGVISGCGGGILGNLLSVGDVEWQTRTPRQLQRPGIAVKSVFVATVLYYFLTESRILATVLPWLTGRPKTASWFPIVDAERGMLAACAVLLIGGVWGRADLLRDLFVRQADETPEAKRPRRAAARPSKGVKAE